MENFKTIDFVCDGHQDENTLLKVSELNSLLEDLGVSIIVRNTTHNNTDYSYIAFKCDTEKLDNFRSRGAGRKKAQTNDIYFADQVREMMKTKTADEVAKSMGISRATLFRRLKHADETGNDNI